MSSMHPAVEPTREHTPHALTARPGRPRVIVAQTGARHNYAVARMLYQRGCLAALYTDFCLSGALARLGSVPIGKDGSWTTKLSRRTIERIPAEMIRSAPSVNLLPRLRGLRGHARFRREDVLFGRVMKRWGFRDANVVYAMFGNGQSFLDAARRAGLRVVIEVFITPIGHRIVAEEIARYPDWHSGSIDAVEHKEAIESKVYRCIEVADLLVCPSQTVRDGLMAYGDEARGKSVVIPYANTAEFHRPPTPERGRVLFAGTAKLRKGIHYLADAANRLRGSGRDYTFAVAGRASKTVRRHPQAENLTFLGHLGREDMNSEFLRADVFVLPTLVEGSASVIYEALAAGVPVVTTPSAGSVVADGVEGFIVPERDSGALASSVRRIVEDRRLRDEMSAAAVATARDYTIDRWGNTLIEELQSLL